MRSVPAEETAFLDFERSEGIRILPLPEASTLVISSESQYPHPDDGEELNKLLLDEASVGDTRQLELPENFATMTHVLNDAIGDNTSERAKDQVRSLFEEVGRSMGQVALIDGLVPVEFSYKNIIFSREHPDPKLLPPIHFTPFSSADKEVARKHVETSLRRSIESGVANTTQRRNSMSVFSGFLKGFDW